MLHYNPWQGRFPLRSGFPIGIYPIRALSGAKIAIIFKREEEKGEKINLREKRIREKRKKKEIDDNENENDDLNENENDNDNENDNCGRLNKDL